MLRAVSAFVARAAEKRRRQGDLAHVLTLFLSKNRLGLDAGGHSRSAVLTLPLPTSDTRELTAWAAQLLARLWEPGTVCVKAGVVLAGLEAPGGQQLRLFGEPAPMAAGIAVAGPSAQMMALAKSLVRKSRLDLQQVTYSQVTYSIEDAGVVNCALSGSETIAHKATSQKLSEPTS